MPHQRCCPVGLGPPSQAGTGLLHQNPSFSLQKGSCAPMLLILAARRHQDTWASYSALFRRGLTPSRGTLLPRHGQLCPTARCHTTLTQVGSTPQLCPSHDLSDDWVATADFSDHHAFCLLPPCRSRGAHCSPPSLMVTCLGRTGCVRVKETAMPHAADSTN